MRILLKFAGTNEVIGSLTLERDPSVVGAEPRELAFMGYSGQALYQPSERDDDVVLHISGFNKVSYTDGGKTVNALNEEREEDSKAKEDALKAAENTEPPVHPSALPPVAAKDGERMDVNAEETKKTSKTSTTDEKVGTK